MNRDVRDRMQCDRCRRFVNRADYKFHIETNVCKLIVIHREMTERGYMRIDVSLARSLKSSGHVVGRTYGASNHLTRYYIPAWVHKITFSYKSQDYAGLTLSQYLKKLNPDK